MSPYLEQTAWREATLLVQMTLGLQMIPCQSRSWFRIGKLRGASSAVELEAGGLWLCGCLGAGAKRLDVAGG